MFFKIFKIDICPFTYLYINMWAKLLAKGHICSIEMYEKLRMLINYYYCCWTANEVCDRFVGAGFHSNLITYLTQVLNVPLIKASNTLANFSGVSNFTPLIGALVADSFAGRFWTIIVGSIIYEMVCLYSLSQTNQ